MKLFYLPLLFILFGCGHGKISLESYPPKADVSVVEGEGQIRRLGQTPLDVDIDDLRFNKGMLKIVFSKNGHKSEMIYLAKPAIKTNYQVSANLTEMNSAKELISNEKLEGLSTKIAEAQRLSYNKKYSQAERILKKLVDDYPGVSVPYDLLANIYYLSNRKREALLYYQKADQLSPGNGQRDFLINKLRRFEVGQR